MRPQKASVKPTAQVETTGEALASVYTRAVGSSNLSAPTRLSRKSGLLFGGVLSAFGGFSGVLSQRKVSEGPRRRCRGGAGDVRGGGSDAGPICQNCCSSWSARATRR